MPRYIDADDLRDNVLNDNTYDNDTVNYYLGWIDDAPTADVVPVARGEWILVGTNLTIDGKKFEADNTCKTCANKGICKYVDYYSGLITSAQQISADSNFKLHLRCKQYRNETSIRG